MLKLQNVNDYIKEHGLKPSQLEIDFGHSYDEENDVTWLYTCKEINNTYLTRKNNYNNKLIKLQGKIED